MSNFIVFSGLDGSGKSTQIELLKNYLINNRNKCFIFWSRGGYTPGFQLLKNIFRFFLKGKFKEKGHTPIRKKALANKYISNLWIIVSILDLFFYYAFYLRVKKFFDFYVICDRYIIDTKIDFELAFPDKNIDKWYLWKVLEKISLKPDFHFILTISVDESLRRSQIKQEPFPDSKEALSYRLKKYNQFSENNKFFSKISCEKDINYIHKQIKSILSI